MRNTFLLSLVAALVAAPSVVLAEEKPGAQAVVVKGKGPAGAGVARALEIQGVVTAIDKENRTITVKGPQGNLRDIKVGEGARNFDQLKVGDMVTLAYAEALTLTLEKSKGAKPGKVLTEEFSRAAAGQKPGGKIISQLAVIGTVTAIDADTQMVTVRGPEGKELDIKVQDMAKLKNLKIGDLVKATYTEAVAISVTAPANPAATQK